MTALAKVFAVALLTMTVAACGGPDTTSAAASGDPADAVGAPCMSSAQCAKDEVCTTQDGVCNRPPGCTGICPAVCYGTCRSATGTGPACGSKTCPAGQVCCNASCGICTPPGYMCTQQVCPTPPPTSPCKTDDDCRAFSSYCQGCSCRALSVDEKDPICSGNVVYCFVDPCRGREAYCQAGACALRTASITAQ